MSGGVSKGRLGLTIEHGMIHDSSSLLPPPSVTGNPTDTLDFALAWPAREVILDSIDDRAIRGLGREVHTLAPTEPNMTSCNLTRKVSTAVNHPCAAHVPSIDSTATIYSNIVDSSYSRRNSLYLPLEIVAMIISHAQLAEPRCALSLVVPDWEICAGGTSELGKSSRITRIVTYVRSMGVQVGTLSHTFEHGDNDHILTPTRSFDENVVTVNVSFASEYTRNYYRGHTHVFTLGTTTSLPSRAVEEMLGNNGGHLQPLRGQRVKSILPFDDEPLDEATRRKAAATATPTPIYQHLRHVAVHSPLELMRVNAESLKWAGHVSHEVDSDALNDALDLDRSAHLWLSWSRMTNLESVFLDLRIYSHDVNTERRCLAKAQVIERAREMGRHLQLQMLMLAGLQSYSFHAVYDGITARDIEEIDEMNGEPNWIKIFRPAVRPGGKIVLVDRLTDHLSHRHCLLDEIHDIGRV